MCTLSSLSLYYPAGLVAARMMGALAATADDVLIFLDSHVEVYTHSYCGTAAYAIFFCWVKVRPGPQILKCAQF